MPSSYSNNLKIELIATGEQDGSWGATTNDNFEFALEQAIVGQAIVTFPSDADYTLTLINSNAAQDARAVYLVVQSAVSLSASRNLIVPTAFKNYVVKNDTSGSQSIVVKTSAGTGVTIPSGKTVAVYVDGTNVIEQADRIGSLDVGTLTSGNASFTGTPTAPTASPGTNTTQIATTAFVKAALQALYPVGSIYFNATNSTNPATLLGFGTWVAFGAGRVPVGFDAGDPLFDTAEETGGSKDAIVVSHTHTATVTDPGHTHSISSNINTGPGGGGGSYLGTGGASFNTGSSTTGISVGISTTGSSGTNANLQPYITVYMWKRTA